MLTANHLATDEEKQHLYWDIKSAAATGWDFSSRWVIHDGTNGGKHATRGSTARRLDVVTFIPWC